MSAADHLAPFLAALLAGSRRDARRVVDEARADGAAISDLYLELFQPALREVGSLWETNRITVAEEHLATALVQTLMAGLYDELFDSPAERHHSLIAACADVERHEVGLRMLCDLLETEGWDTTFLGASVPIESLVAMVRRRRPDVVALSVALVPHLGRAREMILALRAGAGEPAPLVMVGGRPFLDDPAMAARIGADLTARDAKEAVALLRDRFGG